MKKAIIVALIGCFIIVATTVFSQTSEEKTDRVILPTNNSNAAKKYIKDTKIEDFVISKNEIEVNASSSIKAPSTSVLYSEDNSINNDSIASNSVLENDEGSLPLFSNNTNATGTTRLITSANAMTSTLSLITSLIGIIILALIISWFIQKKTGFGANNFGKVLGIVPLDNKRLLYIVDVMGKMLVLGVTESSINLITEITDKDTVDAYRLKYGQSVTPGLDKLFPFLNKQELNAGLNKQKLSEDENKILTERNASNISKSIEENHKNRKARLNNMIIK